MDSKKMNAFKRLIKESVREAVREELSKMLTETRQVQETEFSYGSLITGRPQQQVNESYPKKSFSKNQFLEMMGVVPGSNPAASVDLSNLDPSKRHFIAEEAKKGNPLIDLLAETAASMKPGEEANFRER